MAAEHQGSMAAPVGGDIVARLAATDGSAAHAFVRELMAPQAKARDLGDAVHALCAVHGHHPGMIGAAAARHARPPAGDWLNEAVLAFDAERAFLARLTAAAGPLPSTPGQAVSEAALAAERHALEMLAHSEREGCAIGAVAALIVDWGAIRGVLARAAERFGADIAPWAPPLALEAATIVAALAARPATERAIAFGAQQLFAQHRGLWSLLEARASARHRA